MRFTSIFTGLVAAVSAVQAGVIGARIPSTGTTTQMTRRTMHEFAPRAVQGTVCLLVGPLGVGIPLLQVQVIDVSTSSGYHVNALLMSSCIDRGFAFALNSV